MNQYSYQPDTNGFHNPVLTGEVQRSILEAYVWMFAGVACSALTAFVFYQSGLLVSMLTGFPMLAWLLPICQIALAIAFTAMLGKASVNTLRILFLLYSLTMGISLTSLGYAYDAGTLFIAFAISAAYFGCLVIVGYTTKMDLTKIGTICLIGLLVMIISQVVMMLFRVNVNTRLLSIVGLLMFTGLTAWDVQRLNKTMLYAQGQPVAQKKWAIYFAFQLYLDFINIFLYILRLLGMGSSNRH